MFNNENRTVKVAWLEKDSDDCNVHMVNLYLDEMEHCTIHDVYGDNAFWLFVDTGQAPLDMLETPQEIFRIMQIIEEEIDGNYDRHKSIRIVFDGGKYMVIGEDGRYVEDNNREHRLVNEDVFPTMEFGIDSKGDIYFVPNYYSGITYHIIND